MRKYLVLITAAALVGAGITTASVVGGSAAIAQEGDEQTTDSARHPDPVGEVLDELTTEPSPAPRPTQSANAFVTGSQP